MKKPSTVTVPFASRKKVIQWIIGGFLTVSLLSVLVRSSLTNKSLVTSLRWQRPQMGCEESRGLMWGWTEAMGWHLDMNSESNELGEVAEGRFRLNVDLKDGGEGYYMRLHDFAISLPSIIYEPFLVSLYAHLPSHLRTLFPPRGLINLGPPAMIAYKNIFQTDKLIESAEHSIQAWTDMNFPDGWEVRFFDDQMADRWVKDKFGGTSIAWAWEFMHRGVLRADFLRYLLPLVEGGVYSDVDTRPIRPIEQWGQIDVEYLDLSETDGPDFMSKLSTSPAVIVGVDIDVHSFKGWENSWPRALGICQWTLSSAPNHPIFLDAVRRVVNATRVVEQWEEQRAEQISSLKAGGGEREKIKELEGMGRGKAMQVMEWTGPGLFTDSVLAYLLVRYNVTWHRLRGLTHPLRIGEVLILPITGFSPGGQPDFRAETEESPQANVVHDFRGSWKGDGMRRRSFV